MSYKILTSFASTAVLLVSLSYSAVATAGPSCRAQEDAVNNAAAAYAAATASGDQLSISSAWDNLRGTQNALRMCKFRIMN